MDRKILPPLTTREISRYLQVDLTTVIHWCDQGKLTAYKTPGGHRRIQPDSFLKFLEEYRMPLPEELKAKLRGGVRVLIVDDEAVVRSTLLKAMRKKMPDVSLYEASDGFEAGKMVVDVLPDLVILDLKLPGLDGFKVCENIRKDPRLRDTRILAITGQDSAENRKKIMDAGADDYLPKPFGIEELLEKVKGFLQAPMPS